MESRHAVRSKNGHELPCAFRQRGDSQAVRWDRSAPDDAHRRSRRKDCRNAYRYCEQVHLRTGDPTIAWKIAGAINFSRTWRDCILLGLALAGQLCLAQSTSDALKIGPVTVQGSVRTRAEGWQWFEGQGDSDYVFSGSLLRLSFSHESPSLDWRIELGAPILL